MSRLVWLSSFGVGDTYRSASVTQKVMYRTFLLPGHADQGPAKGRYRVGERLPMKGNPTISRADAADFLFQAARAPEWIHRDAVIAD
ncbi:NAD(P)-dependent oxidoreductase [Streptomyces massasporeus]|uniref:hypothetical protein n=1 Tax=Streptomyces massasporeus TaxID=67324 RepID=UPI0036ACFC02